MKWSFGDKMVSIMIVVIMAVLSAAFLLPFLLVVGSSLLTPAEYAARGMVFVPRHPTLDTYRILLAGKEIWDAYGVSVFRTLVGTRSVHISCTWSISGIRFCTFAPVRAETKATGA